MSDDDKDKPRENDGLLAPTSDHLLDAKSGEVHPLLLSAPKRMSLSVEPQGSENRREDPLGNDKTNPKDESMREHGIFFNHFVHPNIRVTDVEEANDSRGVQEEREETALVLLHNQSATHTTIPPSATGESDCINETNLWRRENFGLLLHYFMVGTMEGLFKTLLNVYPLDSGATEAQQTTLASMASLPTTLKIFFGILTDHVPLCGGYRRQPYLILGWMGVSLAMTALFSTSNLTLLDQQEQFETTTDQSAAASNTTTSTTNNVVPPPDAPSMAWLSLTFLLFGISLWFADATADAFVAEKARYEPDHSKGSLQSWCYVTRFFALMVWAPLGTWLYDHPVHGFGRSWGGPQGIVQLLAGLPLLELVALGFLSERPYIRPSGESSTGWLLKRHADELWRTVCRRSVWQPIGFVYLVTLLHIPNAAWRQFLFTVLHFSTEQLNALVVASQVMLFLGTLIYKTCCIQTSWRRIFLICLLLNAVFSAMQVLLIRGWTMGISPFLFALGDDGLSDLMLGIYLLPTSIMMVSLCPSGSEGTSYAMFITVWNSAIYLRSALASLLLGIWDVSRSALEQGDLAGLFRLALLTTTFQGLPLFLLSWMPQNRWELAILEKKNWGSSRIGGTAFLLLLNTSLLTILVISALNILNPLWAG